MKEREDELSSVNNDVELLKKVQQEQEEMQSIPGGYILIELSEQGKLKCAPAKFHIKNFTTEGMIDLSMVQPEELPIKLADCLDDLIYEKGVSVKDFNEKEVLETLVKLYQNFYSQKLEGLEYTPTKEDWDWVAKQNGGYDSDEFKRAERNLKSQPLKFNLDLNQVHYDPLPDNFHAIIKATKDNGRVFKFGIPRYGDAITIANFMKAKWSNKDKQFEATGRIIKFREENEARWRQGENINLRSIPDVPQKEKDEYFEYNREKMKDTMIAFKAQLLREVDGVDISGLPLDKRFEYACDPELDHATFQGALDFFQSQKFGINNEVEIVNPLTGQPGKYNYPFRIDVLIQAFYSSKPTTTTYEFE